MTDATEKPSRKGIGGRPSLYRDAYVNEVIQHLAQGYTLASWGGQIGVCRDTVHEWSKVHPEFSDAVKKGRAKGQALWEERLAAQALTGTGNTTAIIFAMKNLYKDDWADKIVNEHTGEGGGPLTVVIRKADA